MPRLRFFAAYAKALDDLKLEGDEKVGADIVKKAMQEPLRQIAENVGEEGAVILGKVAESTNRISGKTLRPANIKTLSRRG